MWQKFFPLLLFFFVQFDTIHANFSHWIGCVWLFSSFIYIILFEFFPLFFFYYAAFRTTNAAQFEFGVNDKSTQTRIGERGSGYTLSLIKNRSFIHVRVCVVTVLRCAFLPLRCEVRDATLSGRLMQWKCTMYVPAQATIEVKPFSGSNVSAVHRAKHLMVYFSIRGRACTM